MASALETLCGQAYGARQYYMLGVYLQRSWIVLLLCSIILTPVFIFTTPILKVLGQDEAISEVAGVIAWWLIPVMFSFIVSFTCQMFLQAQSKNMIIAYLAAFSIAIHIFLSWLLIVKYKLGIPGAMISTILAFWIPNVGQLTFILFGGCRETWKGFSYLAFKDLWPIIKLSLSSGVMLCLEVWYNTVLVLLTGNMKNAEVAIDALSICLNINGWEMMISLGFLAAAGVRVSNELGRGSSKAAKFSILVSVLTSFAIGFMLFIFFLFFRGRLAYIFTESREVAIEVADLSPLLAFSGVWIGMLFGTLVQTVVLTIITYKTDWDEQVSIAQQRITRWFVGSEQQAANPQGEKKGVANFRPLFKVSVTINVGQTGGATGNGDGDREKIDLKYDYEATRCFFKMRASIRVVKTERPSKGRSYFVCEKKECKF
ncbi:unnamed protein product [Ilex paraguariensis]|uniref:Protein DETOXIFICATION n=1 Tax=Ilex paraguariensis TaxID=185542 RepID=A0ABC8SKA0_9AQUA